MAKRPPLMQGTRSVPSSSQLNCKRQSNIIFTSQNGWILEGFKWHTEMEKQRIACKHPALTNESFKSTIKISTERFDTYFWSYVNSIVRRNICQRTGARASQKHRKKHTISYHINKLEISTCSTPQTRLLCWLPFLSHVCKVNQLLLTEKNLQHWVDEFTLIMWK